MTTKQENVYAMLFPLHAFLSQHVATSEDAGFRTVFATFDQKFHAIVKLTESHAVPIRGVFARRDDAFAVAVEATLEIGARVHAYAKTNRLFDLAAQTRVYPSDFFLRRIAARLPLMRQVHAAALGAMPAVSSVGVTAGMLADLAAKIGAAGDVVVAPRGAIVERKVTTQQLKAAFNDMGAFLREQLDPVMRVLKRTDPALHEAYRATRLVIHHGGPRQAVDAAPVAEAAGSSVGAAPA